MCRRELRKKGKNKVPLKSRDWVLAKKQRLRKQGKYVLYYTFKIANCIEMYCLHNFAEK